MLRVTTNLATSLFFSHTFPIDVLRDPPAITSSDFRRLKSKLKETHCSHFTSLRLQIVWEWSCYLHSRDTASVYRLIYHMHVCTHTHIHSHIRTHSHSHTASVVAGCWALGVLTRDSYSCPLVAALSPKEKLGQNCMREKVCCIFLSLIHKDQHTHIHTHTHQTHTQQKYFYIGPALVILRPHPLAPFGAVHFLSFSPYYVYVSACCCLHSSTDSIIVKCFLPANSTISPPSASDIATFNLDECTAFTKRFNCREPSSSQCFIFIARSHTHTHTQIRAAMQGQWSAHW